MIKKFRGVIQTKCGNFSAYYKGRSKGTYSTAIKAAKIYDIHVYKDNKNIRKANFNMSQSQIEKLWKFYGNYVSINQEKNDRYEAKSQEIHQEESGPIIIRKEVDGVFYESIDEVWSFEFKTFRGHIKRIGQFKSLDLAIKGCEQFNKNNKGC